MQTDHSKVYYAPFRKNFYVEVPEIARMTPEGKFYKFDTVELQWLEH